MATTGTPATATLSPSTGQEGSMSFSIAPITDPYPTPLVDQPQSATDRRRARDERQRQQQHAHPQAEPERAPADAAAPAMPDADAPLPIGTLIDVRA